MPDPATIGQRFTQLIQQLGLSKNAFAQSLDRTATVIQHLVDERNKPGYDLLCKVFEVYPNISKDWLLLGNGPMLLNADTPELFVTEKAVVPALAADEAIDLATIAGPARRRTTPLQPAEVAATVALAATQATQAHAASQPPAQPHPTPAPVSAPLLPVASASQAPLETVVPVPPVSPAVPDPAYLAALLQAQHVQHQLALSEQRNQHLVEQQQLLQQMVQLLQRAV